MRTGTAVSRSCMAVNQWRSAHVRSKREGQTADPVDEIEQWLTWHELTEALAQLSTAHREILVAAFVHDRPYREIAEALGIPAGTVKSRVFHALRALREHIAVDQ
jgi:RNA polymerase sigma-70 factor, ECF subfamily